jgi:hypothetical protein
MRGRLLLGLFVVGLVGVSVAAAGLNRNWSVHANGGQEVPAHDTQGQAQAIFHLSTDGSSLEYKLIAANIDPRDFLVTCIHGCRVRTARSSYGSIVDGTVPGPPGAGRTDGVLAEGTITART